MDMNQNQIQIQVKHEYRNRLFRLGSGLVTKSCGGKEIHPYKKKGFFNCS